MKNRKLFIVSIVLLVSMFSAALAGCSGQQATPATETTQATTVEQPTASGEKVKIVYWSMFSEGEPLQQLLAKATTDFMAENPNITVEIKWAGRQNLTQLQSAIAAGTQVDIVDHSDDRVFNAIVTNNLALPLDKYLDEPAYNSSNAWKDTFVPGTLDIGKGPDGKTYLIPREDYISAFFYNKKMFNDAGYDPKPSGMTWEEFTGMLDGLKTKVPTASPLGADGNVSFYNNWYFTYMALRLAGKDAFRDAAYDKTGEKWSDPNFLKAAQMVRELQDKGYFQAGFEGSVWPAAQVQWVNNQVGAIFNGAWLPTEMTPQMPEGFTTGMFAFPTVSGGQGNEIVEHWANVYGVLASTKSPDAVMKYLKYIMSPKVAPEIVKLGSPVPLKDVPVPPALENQYKILAESTAIPARAGLNTEIPEYMDNVFNVCDDKFFQLQIGPEELIDCLKTESAKYWANK